MNEDTGVHYLTPWKINETIEGLGGIGEIIEILGTIFLQSPFFLHQDPRVLMKEIPQYIHKNILSINLTSLNFFF